MKKERRIERFSILFLLDSINNKKWIHLLEEYNTLRNACPGWVHFVALTRAMI